MLTIILAMIIGFLILTIKNLFQIWFTNRKKKTIQERAATKWAQMFYGIWPEAILTLLLSGFIGLLASFIVGWSAPTADVLVDTRELISFNGEMNQDVKYVATCDWRDTTIYGFYEHYGTNGRRYNYVTADGTARIVEGEGDVPVVNTYARTIEPAWTAWTFIPPARSQFYEIRVPANSISSQDCREDAIQPVPDEPDEASEQSEESPPQE